MPSESAELLNVQAVMWNPLGPGSVAYTVNQLIENLLLARLAGISGA